MAADSTTTAVRQAPIAIGDVYGRLTVIDLGDRRRSPGGHTYRPWVCRCECGTIVERQAGSIRSGRRVSCGCWVKELTGNMARRHGASDSRLYTIWRAINARCYRPSNIGWDHYGGRGIRVCDEWRLDAGFEPFRDWALAHGYDETLTIDRIDSDGHYEAANCRWVDVFEQNNNKRTNVRLTAFGETKTLAQWERDPRCGVTRRTIVRRLARGWPEETAISTSERPR